MFIIIRNIKRNFEANAETIYTQTTKAESAGCTFISVQLHTIYAYVYVTMIKEKKSGGCRGRIGRKIP